MTEILLRCVLLSLVTIGIFCTFWTDMIFEKPCDKLKLKIGEFYAKPICACYVCGTFWVSLIICLSVGWQWWLAIPSMGVSAVISQLSKD